MQGKLTEQMVRQDQLFKHLAGPRSEDESSSDSEDDYGHSGGDFMDDEYFMDDEVTQNDLLEAWGNASEVNDPEDEDEKQASGHPLSPATRPKSPEHLADPPPPPRDRSCRPKEPPPQKPIHNPPDYLKMGGLFVAPSGYNASKEQRLKDWKLSHKIGWQNFLNSYAKQEYEDECSDEV